MTMTILLVIALNFTTDFVYNSWMVNLWVEWQNSQQSVCEYNMRSRSGAAEKYFQQQCDRLR